MLSLRQPWYVKAPICVEDPDGLGDADCEIEDRVDEAEPVAVIETDTDEEMLVVLPNEYRLIPALPPHISVEPVHCIEHLPSKT